jgi:alpha-beta hydrolase superfamily lysophospholipase
MKQTSRKTAFVTIFICILVTFVAASFWAIGDALSRAEHTQVGAPPDDLHEETVSIDLPAGDSFAGGQIKAWIVPAAASKGIVLLLHGIRADRRQLVDRSRFLRELGYSSLLIDLPAHGESSGDRITFGVRESKGVAAALSYLCARFPQSPLGVIGVSLGAASFVLANPSCHPRAVVLESMFPTIEEATNDRMRNYAGSFLGSLVTPVLLVQMPFMVGVSPSQLRPIDEIRKIGCPVLIASGSIDRNTTLAETQRIFQTANEPKELWIVDGAAHVDLHAFAKAAYEEKIGGFFAKYLR